MDSHDLKPHERIILAVDVDSADAARKLLQVVGNQIGIIKLGLEFSDAEGWAAARAIGEEFGLPVMMDAKTKDIPNTMYGALKSRMRHKPYFTTVMADNSLSALQAAVKGRDEGSAMGSKTQLLGVTVLTSIGEECESIYGADAPTKVEQFACTAKEAGFEGIVCAPGEAEIVKRIGGLFTVCPSIRPLWAVAGDQARPTTPADAVRMGVDYIVIGRPITDPPKEVGSPKNAVKLIIDEIQEALANG